jgi:hypothetical protein
LKRLQCRNVVGTAALHAEHLRTIERQRRLRREHRQHGPVAASKRILARGIEIERADRFAAHVERNASDRSRASRRFVAGRYRIRHAGSPPGGYQAAGAARDDVTVVRLGNVDGER